MDRCSRAAAPPPANTCPTCSRREHRHGFFHGSVTSGRGGGGTWTELKEVRAGLMQQVASMNQLKAIGSKHTHTNAHKKQQTHK